MCTCYIYVCTRDGLYFGRLPRCGMRIEGEIRVCVWVEVVLVIKGIVAKDFWTFVLYMVEFCFLGQK